MSENRPKGGEMGKKPSTAVISYFKCCRRHAAVPTARFGKLAGFFLGKRKKDKKKGNKIR